MGYAIRNDGQGWRAVNSPADVVVSEETYSETQPLLDPAARQSALLKSQAQTALDKSDITVLRCYENAVPVPGTWQAYRTELRAIVSGTSSATELPEMPAYPEGT